MTMFDDRSRALEIMEVNEEHILRHFMFDNPFRADGGDRSAPRDGAETDIRTRSNVPPVNFPRDLGTGRQEAAVVDTDLVVECSIQQRIHLQD